MIGKPNPNKANKVRKLNNKPPLIKANILPSRLPSKRKAMCWSSFHKQDAKPHRECNLSRNLQESQRISMGHQWWWIANRPPRNSTGVSALVSKSSKHMSQLWLSSHMQVSVNGATPQLSSMGFSEFPWTIQRAWGTPMTMESLRWNPKRLTIRSSSSLKSHGLYYKPITNPPCLDTYPECTEWIMMNPCKSTKSSWWNYPISAKEAQIRLSRDPWHTVLVSIHRVHEELLAEGLVSVERLSQAEPSYLSPDSRVWIKYGDITAIMGSFLSIK